MSHLIKSKRITLLVLSQNKTTPFQLTLGTQMPETHIWFWALTTWKIISTDKIICGKIILLSPIRSLEVNHLDIQKHNFVWVQSIKLVRRLVSFIDAVLRPYTTSNPNCIKGTKDFLWKLKSIGILPKNTILATTDVEASTFPQMWTSRPSSLMYTQHTFPQIMSLYLPQTISLW